MSDLSQASQAYNASTSTGGGPASALNLPSTTADDASDSDSLSTSSGDSSSDGDEDEDAEDKRLAAEEYDRMVSQSKLILALAVPFLAGYYGRRFGFKGSCRFLQKSFPYSFSFFFLSLVSSKSLSRLEPALLCFTGLSSLIIACSPVPG